MATDQKTNNIIGLILNIFFPGVGTLIFFGPNHKNAGIWQLVLLIGSLLIQFLGVLTAIFGIGFLIMPLGWIMYLAAWIWALIIGIKLLTK